MLYEEACRLRIKAEQTQNPELYEQAAVIFEGLGMNLTAETLRKKAAHYRVKAKER